MDFIGAKPLVVNRINAEDEGGDMLVFFGAGCGLGTEVLVIGAAVYFQDPAQGLERMLEAEFMYGV